uniref:BZIP domain-containing protein n=1 Tax=Strongyloides stercoralis TaxID=6248 RepID=A0AAF5D4M5_STRER
MNNFTLLFFLFSLINILMITPLEEKNQQLSENNLRNRRDLLPVDLNNEEDLNTIEKRRTRGRKQKKSKKTKKSRKSRKSKRQNKNRLINIQQQISDLESEISALQSQIAALGTTTTPSGR